MDPGTAIAVGQVSAKILSIIWKYYSEVKDAKNEVTHLADEIQDFHNVMQKFLELLQKDSMVAKVPASASLITTIEQSLSDINILESKLDPGTGAKVMKRVGKRALKWPFTKKEVDEWVTRFQRLKGTLILALNADQASLIVDIDANVIQLKQGQEAIEQERQLEKLPIAAGASFDSYQRQHQSQCMDDTRVELLLQLQDWGAHHERPIFWLRGMAGTGKSTISCTLAHLFRSQNTLGGNFFFSRGSGEANNAVNFVGTLAYHLAKTSPEVRENVCDAIATHSDITRQGLRNQWKGLISGPLSSAKFKQRPTLNLVIDALDECGSEDDIRLLLQLFVEAKDLTNIDLGVFVTSRPEIVIRHGFKDIPEIIHQTLELGEIPRQIVEQDISVFLRRKLGRLSELPNWPSEDDIRSLVQKADCLFIYAATVCRFIEDTNWIPEDRLSDILKAKPADGSETAQLDEMYMQVLRCSVMEKGPEREVAKLCDRFKQVVGPIVTLFDELSISAVAKLLSMPVKSVDVALSSLHSVLNVPNNLESPIRLLHPSFHDFLLNETRCGDRRLFIQEALVHGHLVTSCLGAISAGLSRNICNLPTPGSPPQDVPRVIMHKALPKHIQYACQHWVDHLAGTKSDSRAQLRLRQNGEIHRFFQKDFLHWLEAMSLMGKMPQGVVMITKLANMAELVDHRNLHAVVQDAERFILSNRAIIEQAPLQTYASALVFSPTESLTRKFYSDQLPAWLVRQPTVQEDWGNSVQTLEGHEDCVTAIAFSPDGKYLASGSWDAKVRLWDLATGALHSTLQGHGESVHRIAFSPKGQLASASPKDRTIRLWEPVTGATSRILDIETLETEDETSMSISFLLNDDLVIQDSDGSVRIWNRQNDSLSDFLLQGFTIHRLLAVSSQGWLTLKAYRKDSNEAEVLLCDSTTGAMHILNVGDPASLCEAVFSSEGKLALGFFNGTIMVRDPAKDSYKKFDVQSVYVGALSFSPDGKFLVSGSNDRTLRLWELSTQEQSLIGTCGDAIQSVAFSPDGKRIASICLMSTTTQIWEPFSRTAVDSQQGNRETISKILFSPGGDQLACVSYDDKNIQLYDTASGTMKFALGGHSGGVRQIQFSLDGNQLASSTDDDTIRLWDPRTGSERTTLKRKWVHSMHRYGLMLEFSPDGEQLASGGVNQEVCVWVSRTGHLHHRLKGHQRQVSNVRFSPSGKKLASSAEDQTARIWDTMTGELLHRYEPVAGYKCSMAFSPNGVYFACQSASAQSTMLYKLETEEPQETVARPESFNSAIAFSADSMSLACADPYGVMLWDVKNARTMGTIPCHAYFTQLSFSADGTYLKFDQGHVQINKAPESSSGDLSTHGKRWRCDEEWLMQGDRKMLWLPPDFRTDAMAHHDGLFALAPNFGGIVFFKVNQGEAVMEV